MRQVVLSILALFSSLAILVVGNSMLATVLSIRLEMEGYLAGVTGTVLACYSVGFVLGSLYGIRVVNRVGHIRAFAAFAALAMAAVLLHPIHVSPVTWSILRLVVGFCIAGLMLVTESWINARATNENRGTLLATYLVLFFLASAGGQFLIRFGSPLSFPLYSLAAMLIALSVIPISLTRSPAPEIQANDPMPIRRLWKHAELGLAGAFLSGVVTAAFTAAAPIYAVRVGLVVDQVSLFMGVSIIAAMLFQWPIGYLSDFVPRGLVILIAAAGATFASLAASWFGPVSIPMTFASAALFYALISSLYALSLALTLDSLDPSQIVSASATLLLAFGMGTVIGPIGGATMITAFGPAGLFWFNAGALSLLVLIAVHARFRQPGPTVEEQTHCISAPPVSTHVIAELDPRNEEFEPLAEEVVETAQP